MITPGGRDALGLTAMQPKAVSMRSGINLLLWSGPLIEQEINPIRPEWFLN